MMKKLSLIKIFSCLSFLLFLSESLSAQDCSMMYWNDWPYRQDYELEIINNGVRQSIQMCENTNQKISVTQAGFPLEYFVFSCQNNILLLVINPLASNSAGIDGDLSGSNPSLLIDQNKNIYNMAKIYSFQYNQFPGIENTSYVRVGYKDDCSVKYLHSSEPFSLGDFSTYRTVSNTMYLVIRKYGYYQGRKLTSPKLF
jgi:hypothetical protein